MLTTRNQTIEWVFELAKTENAFDELESKVLMFGKDKLVEALLECGVIPEAFAHDSSEEKLWAKYCDILLSLSLNTIGLKARVLRARGNSADVFADGANYTLVGDAKAFRLSRTAKNQKDFKIKALNDWRRQDTYACLAGPLTQFPKRQSQIYHQAVEMNVTLVSYTHLRFLVEHGTVGILEELWKIASNLTQTGSAEAYWTQIDSVVTTLCGKTLTDLENLKKLELTKLSELGNEGIEYWQEKIEQYNKLSKSEAINRLIKSEKIESKIRTIKQAISWTNSQSSI